MSTDKKTEQDGAAFDKQFKDDSNLVKRIDEHGQGLTSWEKGFVETCVEWVDAHKCLTEKMRKRAEQIDERHVR